MLAESWSLHSGLYESVATAFGPPLTCIQPHCALHRHTDSDSYHLEQLMFKNVSERQWLSSSNLFSEYGVICVVAYVMEDDLNLAINPLSVGDGQSLVSQLLEIQKSRIRQPRSLEWAKTLVCLTPSSSDIEKLQRVLKKVPVDVARGDYVAVSYKCENPNHGEQLSGGFTIESEHISELSRTRDEIMDRTLKYMQAFGVSHFWIDQECINQNDAAELECALQSMDLVYRCSKHPIGILTTSIGTQEELDLLHSLLSNGLVHHKTGKLKGEMSSDEAQKMLRFLRKLLEDPWWTRRWIFQEAYCSALHMDLLISHRDGLSKVGWSKRSRSIQGEILFKLVDFRKQATRFALACHKAEKLALHEDPQLLSDVFNKIKSYRTMQKHDKDIGGQLHHGQPMSIQILRDLSTRGVTKPVDTLAILSNCCGYDARLDSHNLEKCGTNSLSLAVLTLLLLNGEILWNKRRVSTDATMLELLEAQIFDHFNPPVEDGQLTFMKKTRFVNVRLHEEGIRTSGHLWNISDTVSTAKWNIKYTSSISKEDFMSKCLHRLARELKTLGHKRLATNIEDYLDDTIPDHLVHEKGLQRVFDDTASMLASAIAAGENLVVVQHHNNHSHWGIFMSDWDESSHTRPTAIFTAYEGAEYDEFLDMTRRPDKYVSLSVYSDGRTTADLPLLRVKGWVNGLTFPDSTGQRNVMFRWPAVLEEELHSTDVSGSQDSEGSVDASHQKKRRRLG